MKPGRTSPVNVPLHDDTAIDQRVPTGIRGLDDILRGGLPAQRVYLLEGDPGTGKTTIALQFLLDGVARGETCLYVTLSETATELRAVARSHGWSLDGLLIHELTPSEGMLGPDSQYSLFHPSEVELSDTIKGVIEQVSRHSPSRVVIDSLSEMRMLASEALRYRRQILALKQFFVGRHTTVLLIDDHAGHRGDLQVQSIAHGVIRLEQRTGEYGAKRRRLEIVKLRGVEFCDGYHDLRITTGGVRVQPRLVAANHRQQRSISPVPSGIAALDDLLGGGLSTGTSAIIIGPAGVGKTSLATQYAASHCRSGGRAAIYLLDERLNTFEHRTRGIGLNLGPLVEDGRVHIEQWDPDQITPGHFADNVRARVERDNVGVVLIDSLNGLLNALRNEATVLAQLHELLSYLNQMGILTVIIVAQHGVLGSVIASPLDISYLADTVIMLRFFEAKGAVHKAISVVKKRTGGHEHTIREFEITDAELRVGPPLTAFRGVLTGVPEFVGDAEPLFEGRTRVSPS
jgi:circadian clock protein KaiC